MLELAPGRGEFLGLLRDAGIKGKGVDVDEGMVEAARVALGEDVFAAAWADGRERSLDEAFALALDGVLAGFPGEVPASTAEARGDCTTVSAVSTS